VQGKLSTLTCPPHGSHVMALMDLSLVQGIRKVLECDHSCNPGQRANK
jgi:hypothetical protein